MKKLSYQFSSKIMTACRSKRRLRWRAASLCQSCFRMELVLVAFTFIFVFMFAACSNKSLTSDEAKNWVNDNSSKALNIFALFNGGCSDENPDTDLRIVDGVNTFAPYENDEFKSIADIKEFTESIYTKEYAEEAFYTPYFETDEFSLPLYKEFNGKLYVNVNNGGKGWPLIEWLTDTLTIKNQSKDTAVLEIEAKFSSDLPNEKCELNLRKVDGKWLLDSSIFGD